MKKKSNINEQAKYSQKIVIKPQRQLGILKGKVKVIFSDDFKMTEEEF
jgi:hypothetical protein